MITDFGDEPGWSDLDDDLADLEQCNNVSTDADDDRINVAQNDTVSSCTNLKPLVSSTDSNREQPPVNAIGYAATGNNIDMNLRPSYQRQDRTTQSLHYFHSYAERNRIDISEMSDKHPSSIDISPNNILPSQSDIEIVTNEYEIFLPRYMFI